MFNQLSNDVIVTMIKDLSHENTRPDAISKIITCQNQIPNLATILWYSTATVTALLGDLVSYYPLLGRMITKANSQKIINVLQIFNIIASDSETKIPFIRSNIPIYIFPYIQLSEKQETWHIAAAALVVFASLVSDSNTDVIKYLLGADFIPIVRKTFGLANLEIQTVSAYIISKILCDTDGISSVLANTEGCILLLTIFTNTFIELADNFNPNLSEYVTFVLSLILPHQDIQQRFALIVNRRLDSISTSKVDAKYKELLYQMKAIVNNYLKNSNM